MARIAPSSSPNPSERSEGFYCLSRIPFRPPRLFRNGPPNRVVSGILEHHQSIFVRHLVDLQRSKSANLGKYDSFGMSMGSGSLKSAETEIVSTLAVVSTIYTTKVLLQSKALSRRFAPLCSIKINPFLQAPYGILIEFYRHVYRTAEFNNACFARGGEVWTICPNPRNYERRIAGIQYPYLLGLRGIRTHCSEIQVFFLSTPNFGAGAGSPKRSITIDESIVGSSHRLSLP